MNKIMPAPKKVCAALLMISIMGSFVIFPPQKTEAATGAMVSCVGGVLKKLGIVNVGAKITQEVAGVVSDEVPVRDKSNLEQTTIIAKNTTSLETKESTLDPCVKAVVKEIVHQLTTSIINWINNGFEGSPTFITDPAGFFADIGDQTLGLFIEGAGLDFLCTPFKLNIQLALRNVYRQDRRVYCTPSRIAQVQNYTNRDFVSIGWGGWLDLTTKNENNVYGSWVDSNNDLNAAINERVNRTLNELVWGNGFLSPKDPETGEITTPGSVIVGQADSVLGSNLRELELAKEFDDIIYALVNQLMNQLITKGLRQ